MYLFSSQVNPISMKSRWANEGLERIDLFDYTISLVWRHQ